MTPMLWSPRACRHRRLAVVLAVIAVVFVVAAAIDVWLALVTGEWWPIVLAVVDSVAAVLVGVQARRYRRDARHEAEAAFAAVLSDGGLS